MKNKTNYNKLLNLSHKTDYYLTNSYEDNFENQNNESNEINTDVKYIKVITKELNIRSAASWDDDVISGTVKKGEVFTVVKKIKVDSSYMYKLKSGYFISASSKYVEELKKQK